MGHGILFDAFIYLSAAVIAVPLAKRWGWARCSVICWRGSS